LSGKAHRSPSRPHPSGRRSIIVAELYFLILGKLLEDDQFRFLQKFPIRAQP
jgi:hypothetical protein